jgi:hypothetical protein
VALGELLEQLVDDSFVRAPQSPLAINARHMRKALFVRSLTLSMSFVIRAGANEVARACA